MTAPITFRVQLDPVAAHVDVRVWGTGSLMGTLRGTPEEASALGARLTMPTGLAFVVADAAQQWAIDTGDCSMCGGYERSGHAHRHDDDCPVGMYARREIPPPPTGHTRDDCDALAERLATLPPAEWADAIRSYTATIVFIRTDKAIATEDAKIARAVGAAVAAEREAVLRVLSVGAQSAEEQLARDRVVRAAVAADAAVSGPYLGYVGATDELDAAVAALRAVEAGR